MRAHAVPLVAWHSMLCRGRSAQQLAFYATARDVVLSDVRSVIRFAGKDIYEFLQGMITNDIRPLQQRETNLLYAAFLTPKGKYLHDIFLHRAQGEDDVLLADVDLQGKAHLLQMLTRYKLRRDVQLMDMSDELTVAVRLGGGQQAQAPAGCWHLDPRLPELGLRAVLPRAQLAGNSSTNSREYKLLRFQHGVAEGDEEIPADKAHPLEYNLDVLNGVSYAKGCYIGQERNSFTHYRGIIRKRLMPARLQGPLQDVEPGALVTAAGSGDSVGSVRAVEGDLALVHVRLAPALQAAESADDALQLAVAGSSCRLKPWRPHWWPAEWGFEEQQQQQRRQEQQQ